MAGKREQIRKELNELVVKGYSWITAPVKAKGKETLKMKNVADIDVRPFEYQPWYSQALPLVQQILPDRYDEFVALYSIGNRRKIDYSTYGISDYLQGLGVSQGSTLLVDPKTGFLSKFHQQLSILSSAQPRLDSAMADVSGVIRAEFFDDELDKCSELVRNDYLRAAGVVAGVVLESHLSSVCTNHRIKFRKQKPRLADFNDILKKNGVLDTPEWRRIQRLGDLRNLCGHAGEREPTVKQVTDLIEGVRATVKTVF